MHRSLHAGLVATVAAVHVAKRLPHPRIQSSARL
jgi:hypothetical protein